MRWKQKWVIFFLVIAGSLHAKEAPEQDIEDGLLGFRFALSFAQIKELKNKYRGTSFQTRSGEFILRSASTGWREDCLLETPVGFYDINDNDSGNDFCRRALDSKNLKAKLFTPSFFLVYEPFVPGENDKFILRLMGKAPRGYGSREEYRRTYTVAQLFDQPSHTTIPEYTGPQYKHFPTNHPSFMHVLPHLALLDQVTRPAHDTYSDADLKVINNRIVKLAIERGFFKDKDDIYQRALARKSESISEIKNILFEYIHNSEIDTALTKETKAAVERIAVGIKNQSDDYYNDLLWLSGYTRMQKVPEQ